MRQSPMWTLRGTRRTRRYGKDPPRARSLPRAQARLAGPGH
ncbi:hypothetical protein [Streptomyces sp. NPDC056194]